VNSRLMAVAPKRTKQSSEVRIGCL